MVAVSESTPGPIAVNMATVWITNFLGHKRAYNTFYYIYLTIYSESKKTYWNLSYCIDFKFCLFGHGTIFYIVQEDIIKTDFFTISSAKFKFYIHYSTNNVLTIIWSVCFTEIFCSLQIKIFKHIILYIILNLS